MIIDYNKRELKRLSKIADKVILLDKRYSMYTDEELREMTDEFRNHLRNGKTLDDILIEAFAVCREVSFRVLGKKHYKVQIIAGIALHQGRVVEMKTGEGKTLTEICPAYLNALKGKGTHVITVNDYLAERDYEEMKPVYEFLGLTVGLVTDDTVMRKEAYLQDITYTTNTQVGFDYLRDNTCYNKNYKVLRPLEFAIIDEVDSVLIDDSRTPLILSSGGNNSNTTYMFIDKIIKSMNPSYYEYDPKVDSIYLNEKGTMHVEKVLGTDLMNGENTEYVHMLNQSLRANYLLRKDKDYIVDEDEVILIDQTTGRIADGRRFSNGLHQALEAKEGVSIKEENETVATITYQNFFGLYKKISGMSGTVMTEEHEFQEIYKLDIIQVPTNNPIQRVDLIDKIYATKKEKFKAILKDIKRTNAKGQPLLVCSQTIEEAEELSYLLEMHDIKHNLLTAKTKAEEAEIISRAGIEGSITISTNMAGRGTDIKPTEKALSLGGLKVIGIERSPIKRVDNQLIGRSGRQGNVGCSQFYISLEDDLFAKFGTDYVLNYSEKHHDDLGEITTSRLLKEVNTSQRIYSGMMYESRKDTVKYDEVLNYQRNLVYKDRDRILDISDDATRLLGVFICNTILEQVSIVLSDYTTEVNDKEVLFDKEILNRLSQVFNVNTNRTFSSYHMLNCKYQDFDKLKEMLATSIINQVNLVFSKYEAEVFIPYILGALLKSIDTNWIAHLNDMEVLRIIVRDQQYNQRKPEEVYKLRALEFYNEMKQRVQTDFIKQWFHVSMPYIENYMQKQAV